MITKIKNETPFQVLTSSFSISPSESGYQLQISADGKNYTTLFSVGAGVTRLVTGVAPNSYYRLLGNTSEVVVNWQKSCGEGGGSGSSVEVDEELTPDSTNPVASKAIYEATKSVVSRLNSGTYGSYVSGNTIDSYGTLNYNRWNDGTIETVPQYQPIGSEKYPGLKLPKDSVVINKIENAISGLTETISIIPHFTSNSLYDIYDIDGSKIGTFKNTDNERYKIFKITSSTNIGSITYRGTNTTYYVQESFDDTGWSENQNMKFNLGLYFIEKSKGLTLRKFLDYYDNVLVLDTQLFTLEVLGNSYDFTRTKNIPEELAKLSTYEALTGSTKDLKVLEYDNNIILEVPEGSVNPPFNKTNINNFYLMEGWMINNIENNDTFYPKVGNDNFYIVNPTGRSDTAILLPELGGAYQLIKQSDLPDDAIVDSYYTGYSQGWYFDEENRPAFTTVLLDLNKMTITFTNERPSTVETPGLLTNKVESEDVTKMVKLTQEQYDALENIDDKTFYIIIG